MEILVCVKARLLTHANIVENVLSDVQVFFIAILIERSRKTFHRTGSRFSLNIMEGSSHRFALREAYFNRGSISC